MSTKTKSHKRTPPPNYFYPVVVGSRDAQKKHSHLGWSNLLNAAHAGADGLRVASGHEVLNVVQPGESAWREIVSPTAGKIIGLLFQYPADGKIIGQLFQ